MTRLPRLFANQRSNHELAELNATIIGSVENLARERPLSREGAGRTDDEPFLLS
jgi:hypothetical protein